MHTILLRLLSHTVWSIHVNGLQLKRLLAVSNLLILIGCNSFVYTCSAACDNWQNVYFSSIFIIIVSTCSCWQLDIIMVSYHQWHICTKYHHIAYNHLTFVDSVYRELRMRHYLTESRYTCSCYYMYTWHTYDDHCLCCSQTS